ncbi:MAG TPA: DJ-1/PfpI family protein [Solirubrobacteraceae bacterium]|jgi:transcriptional regulator GlxA family with amidase domain|nr:DJ-1/PfpI family protein [Solirubrobacteraceae bacterium]
MRTEIVLYEGFEELDTFGPYEVLATAGFAPLLVTLEAVDRVTGAQGAVVVPHGVCSARPDLLVVPGGGWSTRRAEGAWAQAQRGALPAAIAARHRAGATIAGVCTGTMLVAAAGLLLGRPAITHHTALEDLAEAGARVIAGARVVDDGDIVTCAGVTAGIDLALRLVERRFGPAAADAAADAIEYTRQGAPHAAVTA